MLLSASRTTRSLPHNESERVVTPSRRVVWRGSVTPSGVQLSSARWKITARAPSTQICSVAGLYNPTTHSISKEAKDKGPMPVPGPCSLLRRSAAGACTPASEVTTIGSRVPSGKSSRDRKIRSTTPVSCRLWLSAGSATLPRLGRLFPRRPVPDMFCLHRRPAGSSPRLSMFAYGPSTTPVRNTCGGTGVM